MSDFESLLPELEKWLKDRLDRHRLSNPGPNNERVHFGKNVYVNNAMLNCNSGHIWFGDGSFCGYGTIISTCTHKTDATGAERRSFPTEGRDIHFGKEVWIASGAIVLGPCRIGDYSVVGAGSVVLPGEYPSGVLIAGNPARVIRTLDLNKSE